MSKFHIGDRVRISEGSGCLSNKTGVIIDRREIPTDGRGAPLLLGYYKPVDWKMEEAIRLDDGSLTTMFKNRLEVLP